MCSMSRLVPVYFLYIKFATLLTTMVAQYIIIIAPYGYVRSIFIQPPEIYGRRHRLINKEFVFSNK